MEIRRFTEKDDLNQVSRVYAASWRAAYSGIVPQQYLEELGYDKVYLWVLADNHPSRQFYEANGFQLSSDSITATIGGKPLQEVRYIFQFKHKGEPI